MSFQIPCVSGRELTAEPVQAGLRLTCACGRTVVVPPWRKGPHEGPAPPPAGGRPRLTGIGWAFLLLGLAAVVLTAVGADALGLQTRTERK
jgi:hypothetical protein